MLFRSVCCVVCVVCVWCGVIESCFIEPLQYYGYFYRIIDILAVNIGIYITKHNTIIIISYDNIGGKKKKKKKKNEIK